MYYIYMLRCEDNSIYTGISTDLERRFHEHSSKAKIGAKYTKSRRPIKIERAWLSPDRSFALKLEYAIKQLPKSKKEFLISQPSELCSVLGDKLNCNVYSLIV